MPLDGGSSLRKYSLAAACFTAVAASFLLATAPVGAAVRAPVAAAGTAHPAVARHPASVASPGNFQAYYDFAKETTSGPSCLNLVVTANWANYGCRNVDEAFANLLSVAVRLYYSPNEKGAWVCVPAGWTSSDLYGYTFNNGSGDAGYGQLIFNNVASARVSGSNNCTNKI